ncbi:hypothetical protein BWQ96_01207 [Gracilariopsis chorda]|uniref:Aminoglycoside phosphotransferase domain-containing protein n=1 Tax=Gracilariopsis chorda TaxID=448386 RepID=A0A2V3J3W5_9FLOR|nr:hypothetical protein BWQ96_01207 [Gracilariopsis chorda]|eukprot:PXF49069.1 hypothetical protein BWQ96_01207 [Gracilariopsis chorda]
METQNVPSLFAVYEQPREKSATPSPSERPLTFHFLIINDAKDAVLANTSNDNKLMLPFVRPPLRQIRYMNVPSSSLYDSHHWEVESSNLEHFVQTELTIPLHILQTLRCHHYTRPTDPIQQRHVILLAVLHHRIPSHPSITWVQRNSLSTLEWDTSLLRIDVNAQIEAVFNQLANHLHFANPAPWYWLSWQYSIQSWLNRRLAHSNMLPVTSLAPVCKTGEACVLWCRVAPLHLSHTSHRRNSRHSHHRLFLKAVHSQSHEPVRTVIIAHTLPSFVPQVLAVDEHRNVIVMQSAGHLNDAPFDQKLLINTMAQFHLSSMKHLHKFQRSGLQLLDSKWLSANFHSIMHHPALTAMECYPDVRRDINYIRSKLALVQELCADISNLNLPCTLVHGDFRLHNIGARVQEGRCVYRFFDWGSAFVGHPFYDLRTLLEFDGINNASSGYSENSVHLDVDACLVQYLASWKSYASMADLRRTYELMDILRNGISLYNLTLLYDAYSGIERRKLIPRIHSEIKGLHIMLEEFDYASYP